MNASQAQSITVYRCTESDGSVALQDAPCPRATQQEQRSLRRPIESATPPPEPDPAPPADTGPPAAESQPVAERSEPQPLWRCIRHDGSEYESETGVPQRYLVPLWVAGLDPRAPPQLFGRVGKRKPAPPSRQPTGRSLATDPSMQPEIGVWVEDQCQRLSAQATCARRREQLSEMDRRFFNAGEGERGRLRGAMSALRNQLRRECG